MTPQEFIPCPDELLALLPSRALAQQVTEVVQQAPSSIDLMWPLIAMFAGVAVFGLLDWLLWKMGKPTITVANRRGPKWLRFMVAGSLTALIWHLFFQERKKAGHA